MAGKVTERQASKKHRSNTPQPLEGKLWADAESENEGDLTDQSMSSDIEDPEEEILLKLYDTFLKTKQHLEKILEKAEPHVQTEGKKYFDMLTVPRINNYIKYELQKEPLEVVLKKRHAPSPPMPSRQLEKWIITSVNSPWRSKDLES